MSLDVFVFPRNSVKYSQDTMEEALRRVKLMRADLGGTEILTPLQVIYREPSIPGHPLQVGTGIDPAESNRKNEISVQEFIPLSLVVGMLKYDIKFRVFYHIVKRIRNKNKKHLIEFLPLAPCCGLWVVEVVYREPQKL